MKNMLERHVHQLHPYTHLPHQPHVNRASRADSTLPPITPPLQALNSSEPFLLALNSLLKKLPSNAIQLAFHLNNCSVCQ